MTSISTNNTRTIFGFDGLNQVSIADHDGNVTTYKTTKLGTDNLIRLLMWRAAGELSVRAERLPNITRKCGLA